MYELSSNRLKFQDALRLAIQESGTIPIAKRRSKYKRFIAHRTEIVKNEKSRSCVRNNHPNTQKASTKRTSKLCL